MRVSFYECDITPPIGCFMWGHGTKKIAEDVFERLYAKAAVVEQDGEIMALVCVDTCALPEEMHDIVTKRIQEYTGIGPERVCICSNHTHNGAPVLDTPEVNCFGDAAYKDVFFRLTADAVILAYKRLGEEEAQATFGKSLVDDISFNRNGILTDGTYVTHIRGRENLVRPLGEIDPEVSVLTFEQAGKPVGAIINFACHQCCTGGIKGYSGDFSSEMSRVLKERYGNEFVSLFILGTCGDINHVNHDKNIELPRFWHREMGKRLAAAVQEAQTSAVRSEGSVAVIKEKIRIARRQATPEYMAKKLEELSQPGGSSLRLRNLIYYQAVNDKEYDELYVMGMKIGDTALYALPGEVYVQFGLDIKHASPFANNIVIENTNAYCGYIPTKNGFDECSLLYEASLSFHSCLIPEAGDMLVEKALEIGRELIGK